MSSYRTISARTGLIWLIWPYMAYSALFVLFEQILIDKAIKYRINDIWSLRTLYNELLFRQVKNKAAVEVAAAPLNTRWSREFPTDHIENERTRQLQIRCGLF